MRKHLALVSLTAAIACTDPDAPSPTPLASPQFQAGLDALAHPISLDQEVTGALVAHASSSTFAVTTPADGRLTVHLTWNPDDGRLEVQLADRVVAGDNDGSLAGTIAVSAGQTYRIIVRDGSPWDYGSFNLPFTLTTTLDTSPQGWDY